MGQFSAKISPNTGSLLSGNQHSWRQFLLERHPELSLEYDLTVELSEIEEGSLRWLKRFFLVVKGGAAVVAIMANAPAAYENWEEIYQPHLEQALSASEEYINLYLNGLREIAEMTVLPTIPKVPNPPTDQRAKVSVRLKPRRQQIQGGNS